ncbi:uncharacterized protein KIAA1522 homolog isoform X2 [Xyrauchen texanus]|uniref:uncharacterized protein KIAA1522 homolog isoform X2 n=1 Tax=Xyrauchen texanus TaxID=154827 RepID=UPI0022427B42|nr:uncharacterized protein KIAA1522 homolog isoform X2 [Xyrauchen texanus]
MSRSSSVRDLVPRDITEILALQASKKKRGSSLGRAFSWFKGSKRKKKIINGQSSTGGPCGRTEESSTSKQIHASNETFKGQKQDEQRKLTVHYTPSQHYQENVFTEGSKPQYLEDLHTEAQKGLEIFQQEEHKNGVNFQDDQTVSEEDSSSRERDDSLETDSTAGHSVISVSTVSAVSSRPMLTSQGSTFKPLNPVKRLDKTRRRNRRTTIMGIPQQVQRELDMARGTILQQLHNGKHDDDDSSGAVVIPKIDGDLHLANHEGAHVHLHSIKDLQTSRDEELLRHHIQSVYQDDLSLNRKLEPGTCPMQRPKSLAVPGMTTSCFLQEPQGPVMSISPQATYLSKIIPNAIMPAAIDVIEINRCHSRRNASTVSKSSVTTASPAPSRSRLCTNEDPPTTSPNRNHSQSSETIVSNSSTISSKERGPPTYVIDSTKEVSDLNPKDMSIASSKIWITSDRTCTRLPHQELSDAGENGRNSNSSRSLSVMKTKLPPAPPQRTYSLHHEKLKRRSRELEDLKDFKVMVTNDGQIGKDLNYPKKVNQSTNKEKSSVNSSVPRSSKDFQTSVKSSPLSPDQALTRSHAESNNSSPQKIATGENKFDRTLSPSSGYSSQSGTPTHSPKEVSPSSPDKRRFKPSKPERASVRTSTVLSVSSSMTSLSSVTSDTAEQDIQTNTTSEAQKLSPPVSIVQSKVTPTPPIVTLRKLFNIPPPPKVKAPSPPPPETWIYKKRTFELLCGQGPNPYRLHQLQKQQNKPLICKNLNTNTAPNTEEIIPKKQSSYIERKTGSQLENKTIVLEEQNKSVPPQEQKNILTELPALRHNESSKLQRNEQVNLQVRETDQIIHTNVSRKVEDRREEESQTVLKSELPTIEVAQSMLSEKYCDINRGDELVNKTSTPKSNETNTENQNNSIVKDILNHKPMQNLDLEVPTVNGISPSPSTPPKHYPPPPPSKITSASSVFTPPAHEEEHRQDKEEAASLESSWPPPPPPMDSADMMFEEPNELDFPPPPPSFIHEPLSEISNNFQEESCEQHANIELVSPTASDMTSSQKQRSEIDSIIPTRTERNCTVMEDRQHDNPQCCNNVSHLSMDPVHRENTTAAPPKMSFLSLVENTSTKYLQVPPKPPPISAQDSPVQASIDTQVNCTNVPLAPPLSVEDQSTVIFKRHLNYVNKDNRSKEPICRNKSTPIPKEDANIPLVTPSLLQMVRLRSVNVGEDQVNNDSKPSLEATANDEQIQNISSQATPQKPIRRSLTLKSNPPIKSSSATGTVPSMCLQEAIRMKTAALSSSGVPAMLNLRLSSTNSTSSPVPSPKTPEDCNLHRSPASTASFIFSKSTKKLVIETPTSPVAQTSLQQNLTAEVIQVSDQAKMIITNGTKKPIKVPPPVAKKPAHGTNPSNTENATIEQKVSVEVNCQSDTVHPAGQRAQASGSQDHARRTETTC